MKIEIIKGAADNPVAEFFCSSSTPETDAFAIKFKTPCGEKYWVPVDLSRRLERERDEAREALRTLAEHGESEIQRVTKERDETREQATEQFIAAGKAVKERDEAREQAARWLARLQEEGLEEYGN